MQEELLKTITYRKLFSSSQPFCYWQCNHSWSADILPPWYCALGVKLTQPVGGGEGRKTMNKICLLYRVTSIRSSETNSNISRELKRQRKAHSRAIAIHWIGKQRLSATPNEFFYAETSTMFASCCHILR